MMIDLFEKLNSYSLKNLDALIFDDKNYKYLDLVNTIHYYDSILINENIVSGSTVILIGNYSLYSIALFLSLAKNSNVIVPLNNDFSINSDFHSIIGENNQIFIYDNGSYKIQKNDNYQKTNLLTVFLETKAPGLILFTSGITGKPKAILHNLDNLLIKYRKANKSFCTLLFLLFDHVAGIDTLFYTLFAGGKLVIPESRSATSVLQLIDKYKIEVLPVTPSFINLMLLSPELNNNNYNSLKIITFGSERMPESTIKQMQSVFIHAKLIQKYGTSEFGSPISQTKSDDPVWIKFDRNIFDYNIINSMLYIRTNSAMIGYLNAENNMINLDGWMATGDIVETDGEWIKILGRESNIINVGGNKVFPSEVESVLLEIENIAEAKVFGISNPILGNIVAAKLKIISPEEKISLISRVKKYCNHKLESYKVPIKIEIVEEDLLNLRFKKK